jgi:hypothetical protein
MLRQSFSEGKTMSGGSVPYHLRQNKAVERGVFVDMLQRISRATETNIREYRYIGFAGPFSEDFKLVHSHLGIKRYISIENDEDVLKRQTWNQPLAGIDYRCCTARDFIEQYEPSLPAIIWLDYASPAELGSQLSETEMLVSKCTNYDVVKITFNANPATLGGERFGKSLIEGRLSEARKRFGDYLPAGLELTTEDIDKKGYPALILKAAEFVIKAGMRGKASSRFVPLSTFVYSDSAHQMLTLTGIILPKGKMTEFFKQTGLLRWPLAKTKWGNERTIPITIAIPEMSLRERLFVDQRLPRKTSPKTIMKNLGFKLVGGVDDRTLQAISSYCDFYRYFPYFSKMVV